MKLSKSLITNITQEYREQLNLKLVNLSHLSRQVREEKQILREAKARVEIVSQAQTIIQGIAKSVQEQVHKQIASVVTRCLKAVFGEDGYDFRINFVQKRGKTEAELVFVKDGKEIDPTGASGGGAVDVAAFALRLTCLMLTRPPKRRLLVFDEPFKHLNGEQYQERVGELIETLAKEMKIQIIIVSDDDWLKIGKVVDLG